MQIQDNPSRCVIPILETYEFWLSIKRDENRFCCAFIREGCLCVKMSVGACMPATYRPIRYLGSQEFFISKSGKCWYIGVTGNQGHDGWKHLLSSPKNNSLVNGFESNFEHGEMPSTQVRRAKLCQDLNCNMRDRRFSTDERISTTVASLFAQFGYNGVSTRETATAAEGNELTIYRHYHRKRGLYLAVLGAELQRVQLRGELLTRLAEAQNDRTAR